MSGPLCRGELWWRAMESEAVDRMVVVVSAADLRQEAVRVSERISWERTALDLAGELSRSPALAELRRAAHVVVVLGDGEGALWMSRGKPGKAPEFTLLFDPFRLEREWAERFGGNGGAYGYLTTFSASLAAWIAGADDAGEGLKIGIERGLHGMRALSACGHGPAGRGTKPGFPATLLASVIRDGAGAGNPGMAPLDPAALGEFGEVKIPVAAIKTGDPEWRIVEAGDDRPAGEPIYGLARRIALCGDKALGSVPHARFGFFVTADRGEIEALRNLKTLIENYKENPGERKPLSLAVFGPPGAGKSFGVKQIAKGVLGEKNPVLEFNLSQFNDGDLEGAFHQVRDKVLEGHLPLVFWDEFDSDEYKWLRLLLAPMNDGVFQEGQVTHPIGRCIFVFAGATSYNMEHFGPAKPKGAKPPKEVAEGWNQFKLRKGPDFISRIHGCLNVLGPNPRPICTTDRNGVRSWANDPKDACFPVRRAVLLRAMLRMNGDERLMMDHGLIAAMLEVSEYANGARSFEKICESLKSGDKRFCRSRLPADEGLAMNLGGAGKQQETLAEFKRTMDRESAFQAMAEKLAPEIHRSFLPLAAKKNPNNKAYENLPAESKQDNIEAAMRIPWLLSLVGLYVVEKTGKLALSDKKVLQILNDPKNLEMLAEEEHDLWVEAKLANGWVKGPRCDQEHVHDLLVPYRELDPKQQAKDKKNILGIPERVRSAGFSIVAKKPDFSSKAP
jgi:hypothetical protein